MRTWLEYGLSTGVYNFVGSRISRNLLAQIPNGYAYHVILLRNLVCTDLGQIGLNLDSSLGYESYPQPYHQVIHRPCGPPSRIFHCQE